MKRFIFTLILLLIPQMIYGARAKVRAIAQDPYASAVVVDAESGKTLVNNNGDALVYPASVLKLMDLLVILEKIEQGRLQLDEMVQVTKEAAQMGGSQVYLDPKEQFSVEDLLYALMVQSANDAAVALATHVAGSKSAFIAIMNKRAQELGMKNTRFHSVHGLPPSKGQEVDVTTANDLAILARELAKKPETFKYTSIRVRDFRGGEFIMRTHNHLLKNVYGCDGFKTGFFSAAGFSIVATAERNGVRIISIVLGSQNRKVRDAKATELLEKGFAMIPPKSTKNVGKKEAISPQTSTTTDVKTGDTSPQLETVQSSVEKLAVAVPSGVSWKTYFLGIITGIILYGAISFLISRKKRKRYTRYSR
ncbi:MAG: D-alanyl-D-alanine carboxypeptidase [Desulfobulbaceae bacterium]|nr:D-alanyl-D-alanine carboxypeptidase [Desulfobulbaceae bacterium]